jgi:hypothetical protein
MDREEAKKVLQAHRATDLDTTQPAFAEALVLAESDPELKAWWEAQQAFDSKVAAKLQGVPVPADLRASILAGHRSAELFALRPFFPFWLAAAAAVAIICAVGTSFHVDYLASQHIPTDDYQVAALNFLGNDAPDLAMTSTDHDKILAWLKNKNAPMGGDMPGKMQQLATVGCQKYVVHGHDVSLVCFTMADGRIVHLFMVARDALSEPPGTTAPEMKMVNGWATASWSDDHMSYMLATQDNMDALRQLL